MADDMTPGEIARAIARIEAALSEMRMEFTGRVGQNVSTDMYNLQHKAVLEEIAELKGEIAALAQRHETGIAAVRAEAKGTEDRRAEEEATAAKERKTERRWLLGLAAIPTAGLVQQWLGPILGLS